MLVVATINVASRVGPRRCASEDRGAFRALLCPFMPRDATGVSLPITVAVFKVVRSSSRRQSEVRFIDPHPVQDVPCMAIREAVVSRRNTRWLQVRSDDRGSCRSRCNPPGRPPHCRAAPARSVAAIRSRLRQYAPVLVSKPEPNAVTPGLRWCRRYTRGRRLDRARAAGHRHLPRRLRRGPV